MTDEQSNKQHRQIMNLFSLQQLLTYNIENFASENDHLADKGGFINDLIFDPKILVGCMRIDTSFNPQLIPKIQFLVSCNRFEVNLQTHFYPDTAPPPLLKKYQYCSGSTSSETSIMVILSNANFFWSLKGQKDFTIHAKMIFSVKCLDNAFLSVLNFIEDMAIESYFNLKSDSTADINVIANKMTVNFGPSIFQTIMSSITHWQTELKNMFGPRDQENEPRKYILTKFTVVNRTNVVVSFGQSDTQESISLKPQEFTGYSFLSDYFKQKLTFYLERGGQIYESEPVLINFDSNHPDYSLEQKNTSAAVQSTNATPTETLKHVRIGGTYLIVKIRKLSSTQMLIFLKGQIEIVSMVNDLFRMQFRVSDKSLKNSEVTSDFKVSAMQKLTIMECVDDDTNISLRFRFDESRSRSWTGDIPLKSNKSLPWFVKGK